MPCNQTNTRFERVSLQYTIETTQIHPLGKIWEKKSLVNDQYLANDQISVVKILHFLTSPKNARMTLR